ncbi:MAG: hypothetical protein U1E52_16135 [Geminicoccaceae bacterium]
MREARAVLSHLVLCSVVAATTCGLMPGHAVAHIANVRLIEDGCDVGGRGNDIQAIESHYEADSDRIVVTLRLCGPAKPKAIYRVHLDHAAPFVGKARSPAGCVSLADTIVAQTPSGHRGIGSSRIEGNTVRFTVPLDKLHVGTPKQQPLIALWATSTLGGVTDHAPNLEAGDGCAQPQASTETLVQGRVPITGGIAFVSFAYFAGIIGPSYDESVATGDRACQAEASMLGIPNVGGVHAWLANSYSQPANYTDPSFGPIQLPDGTVVADDVATLMSCDASGDPCLQAGIDEDIQGNQVADETYVWTGALPNGTFGYDRTPSCGNWAYDAEGIGTIGYAGAPNLKWTNFATDFCSSTHYLYCIELNGTGK